MEAALQCVHKTDQSKFYMKSKTDWIVQLIDFELASQSVGKEFIILDQPAPPIAGGNGIAVYRFLATKPGKATLTFEYGYQMQIPFTT